MGSNLSESQNHYGMAHSLVRLRPSTGILEMSVQRHQWIWTRKSVCVLCLFLASPISLINLWFEFQVLLQLEAEEAGAPEWSMDWILSQRSVREKDEPWEFVCHWLAYHQFCCLLQVSLHSNKPTALQACSYHDAACLELNDDRESRTLSPCSKNTDPH